MFYPSLVVDILYGSPWLRLNISRSKIEDDFMARQTRAEPVQALAELIWNSVDADASRVMVEFEFKDLAEGMSKIIVYDDGNGIRRSSKAAVRPPRWVMEEDEASYQSQGLNGPRPRRSRPV